MLLKTAPLSLSRLAPVRSAWIAIGVALLSGPFHAPTLAASEARLEETADCIALMQTTADDLARQIKAGDKAREPALRTELRLAGALIARTYLEGLRDGDQAKARLKAAHERQASWDSERKHSVHRACVNRADSQLAGASAPERFAAARFAEVRFKRMLETR
jgi:hypothetical protein